MNVLKHQVKGFLRGYRGTVIRGGATYLYSARSLPLLSEKIHTQC